MIKLRPLSIFISILFAILFSSVTATAQKPSTLRFEQMPGLDKLPNNEVLELMQDSDGFIWIATTGGLYQYDGKQIKEYRTNIHTPNLFNNNRITAVVEGVDKKIYIGTYGGLSILDKHSDIITNSLSEKFLNNPISTLLPLRDDCVLIGSERGLIEYNPALDSCEKVAQCSYLRSIKSLIKDSYGDIWIGTWNQGLYRYSPDSEQLHKYPKLNEQNSAHTIFEDSQKRIWVGSFGYGLVLVHNPRQMDSVEYKHFTATSGGEQRVTDEYIYKICENRITNTIWVGTRKGITVIPSHFTGQTKWHNIYMDEGDFALHGSDIDAIINDAQGNVWIGSIGGGVQCVKTYDQFIGTYLPDIEGYSANGRTIRSITVDSNKNVICGIGSVGLGVHNTDRSDSFDIYSYNLQNHNSHQFIRINSIKQSPNTKHLWCGTSTGLYRTRSERLDQTFRKSIIPGFINQLLHDGENGYWIAAKNGVFHIDETSLKVDTLLSDKIEFSALALGNSKNTLWVGTQYNGVVKLTYNPNNFEVQQKRTYNSHNGLISSPNINCLLLGSDDRLWVGTDGGGLALYSRKDDRFNSINERADFPTDIITSIAEDEVGILWLGSNIGLIKTYAPSNLSAVEYRVFDKSNGLIDNMFLPRSVFKDESGMLYFGTHKGYVYFDPKGAIAPTVSGEVFIIDLKLNNRSISHLDSLKQQTITTTSIGYSDQIVIAPEYTNFTLQFSPMSYYNPNNIRYSYILEGYDKEWQYTDYKQLYAHYANIPYGKYTFKLRSTNEDGLWSENTRTLKINVRPPFYLTRLAILFYIIAVTALVIYIYTLITQRLKLQTTVKIQKLDQERLEAMNHEKLRFFTNITHELFTPITIVAAAMEDLQRILPARTHDVVMSNINRLIRLIQQILEFRKAETGNLKLSVSEQNISQFVEKNIECFVPLMKKKEISIVWDNIARDVVGYIDTDKVDKILYNLLSNALKYNKAAATVEVSLQRSAQSSNVIFSVKDNGAGLSERAMKNLFKRFYDGDFREFNTSGTGIGLSLVHDLVTLHKGEIRVDNNPGKGVNFIVELPIDKMSYSAEECFESSVDDIFETKADQTAASESEAIVAVSEEEASLKDSSIQLLLVEDNEDLLDVMESNISKLYNVITATNGEEALKIIEQETIDLVVSDVMMPIMDGYELSQAIKSNSAYNHIPVILLTAKCSQADVVKGYDSGADSYITKPFSINVLQSRINNLLQLRANRILKLNKQPIFNIQELEYSSYDEEFLQSVITHINENFSDSEYDQHRLSESTGMSKSTLHRKLKSLTGMTASTLIKDIRLKYAFEMFVKRENARISEVAYNVGFNDPKYFSICFKKRFGFLPSDIPEGMTTPPEKDENWS
ncbi:MAG: two-component regulator propeller domain-containing protein [Rikenellaceae bacterium]